MVENFIKNDKFLKGHEGTNWKEENYGCDLQSSYLQIRLTFVKSVQKVENGCAHDTNNHLKIWMWIAKLSNGKPKF